MKIIHRNVASSIFELAKIVELDIQLSDEDAWTTRIELFHDIEQPNRYRCHVWELELFRLTPSFPRSEENAPTHVTDDTIMVERDIARSDVASMLNKPFEASSVEAALEMVVEDLTQFLEHASGEKAK